MPDVMNCDICSRPAEKIAPADRARREVLEADADGLWICSECRSTLRTSPSSTPDGDWLSAELRPLADQSAGAICHTLNLPYEPPYNEIIDAASAIAYYEDRFMSAWTFVTLWLDGTSVWRSPDGGTLAHRTRSGSVQIKT